MSGPAGPAAADTPAGRLRALLAASRRAAILTGAGISTESGIPDFRSPGGVWDRFRPIPFQDFLASEDMRRESWRRKIETDRSMAAAAPNRGHRAIERLVRDGPVGAVITQNIDGLHQASGVPAGRVIELHGNATYASCLECGLRHELEEVLAPFRRNETLPTCRECGSRYVKTATVSFGQPMPEPEMRRAEEEAQAADLFLSIGSSLTVYPAAGVPLTAKRNGAVYAILNREPTGHDRYADLVINDEIGQVLGDAVGVR